MTENGSLESGYVLESVFFPVQQLVTAPADSADSASDVRWGWDWRWNDHERFEVGLLLGAPSTEARPERLEVAASAAFRVVGEAQTVSVEAFAHSHAPALLFPYIRQVVDDLTSRSPLGRVLLPPTNVLALMQKFSADEATGVKKGRPGA